jgi:hypothetical protein
MSNTLDEVSDVKFLFKTQMESFSLFLEHHIDVNFVIDNLGENFVDCREVTGLHGLFESLLTICNCCQAVVATAHWFLHQSAFSVLVDSISVAATFAEESVAVLTVKAGVLEIEF